MDQDAQTPSPPGMFWIKLVGVAAALAALFFAVRIVRDAFREKPEAEGVDEDAHLGI